MLISPNQAILILIDFYHAQKKTEVVDNLKKILLAGVKVEEGKWTDVVSHTEMLSLDDVVTKEVKDGCLKGFSISTDKEFIDQDPTRRYFETNLCFHTLKTSLSQIELTTLKTYFEKVLGLLSDKMNEPELKEALQNMDEGVLHLGKIKYHNSNPDARFSDRDYQHFLDAAKLVEKNSAFNHEEKQKLKLLNGITFVAFVNALLGSETNALPFDIYGKGIFSKEQRGQVYKKITYDKHGNGKALTFDETNALLRQARSSSSAGILKSLNPVPYYDLESKLPDIFENKPAERTTFVRGAKWVEESFALLLHPCVNTISGTMLILIRNTKQLSLNHDLPFTDLASLKNSFKLFIASLLYLHGGHSLYEFTAPFKLDVIEKGFPEWPGLKDCNSVNLFYLDNHEAFQKALNNAIHYNQIIIARTNLRQEAMLHVLQNRKEKLSYFNEVSKEVECQKESICLESFSGYINEM